MVSSSDNSILSEIRQQRTETEEKSSVYFVWAGYTRDKKIAPTHNLPQYSTLLCYKCEKALFLPPTTYNPDNDMTLSKYKFIHGIKHHRLVLFKHVAHKRAKHKYVYKVFHEWKTFLFVCCVHTETCEDGGKCDHVMFVRHSSMYESVGGRHWGW